jgi:predicted  nucleic acid-binding Zn-ribbon protein
MTKDIQKKLEAIDVEFEKIKTDAKEVQESVNEGNRKLQTFREKLIGLQGEYKALNDLKKK